MASREINAYGADVKYREIAPVLWLHALTLGFYNFYWYYKINRELRDFGRVYQLENLSKSNPWLSLLAVTLGWLLIVPPFVSWYRCTKRIQETQGLLGGEPISGVGLAAAWAGGWLLTPVLLMIPYMVQSGLNAVWTAYEGVDPGAGHAPEMAGISIGAIDSLPAARSWDRSALDDDHLNAITHFLLRRQGLDSGARERLSADLAGRIWALVPDADPELAPERLLELVAAVAAESGGEKEHPGEGLAQLS